jgi:hypothetical protein
MRKLALIAALLLLTHPSEARPVLTTFPDPIVLGATPEVRLELRGLAGTGRVQVAVNIGAAVSVEARGGVLTLRYRPPATRFPQVLCLLLWRERGEPAVLRVPLLGRAEVPILTRPSSSVTLSVGGRRFGPVPSGRTGQLTITALVPPGVTEGEATVVDAAGLSTRKRVAIPRPAYPPLALAVRPRRASGAKVALEIALAVAEAGDARPVLELRPAGGEPSVLALRAERDHFRVRWTPEVRPAAGTLALRAWLEDAPGLVQTARAEIAALPPPPPAIALPTPAPPRRARRLLGRVAVSAGLAHNGGALTSPRLGLELGADYPLGPGRVGLLLGASFSWSGHSPAVASAQTSLLVVPLGIGLGYRLELGRLTPYAVASFVAGLARSSGEGAASGRYTRTDFVPGVRFVLGGELRLGRGGLLLQAGYEHGRLDAPEIEGRVGGLLVEAGYRLRL